MEETKAIFPPREVFEDEGLRLGHESSNPVQRDLPVAIGVEYPEEGGVLMHFRNHKYPKKGWPYKQAIQAIDSVKRFLICGARFIVGFPKALFTGKMIDLVIEQIGDFSYREFQSQGIYWKPNFYCTMVREVYRVSMSLAETENEIFFVKGICTILEFDDAYRYFLQDLLGEMNRQAFLINPSKESKRLFDIAIQRGEGTSEKFAKFGKIIPLLLYFPRVKRIMRKFFSEIDMEKLYLDEGDWYYCLTWNGWNFGGRSLSDRLILREEVDEKWLKEGGKYFDSKGQEIIIPKQDE